MPLHTITSIIRGGGTVGASASVGRVVGPDPKWGVALAWVRKSKDGTGRSGDVTFFLDEPGLYKCNKIGESGTSIASQARRGGGRTYWLRVDPDGKAEEVGGEELSPRETLALWEAMQEPAAAECTADGTDDPAAYLAACAPALRLALADLTEWATRQGGYEAREWDVARALLDHLRDKGA